MGYLGRESKLKLQPVHPEGDMGVHVLRSILMAITIFYFTFRPTLNLPRIPSGIKLQTMAKKESCTNPFSNSDSSLRSTNIPQTSTNGY